MKYRSFNGNNKNHVRSKTNVPLISALVKQFLAQTTVQDALTQQFRDQTYSFKKSQTIPTDHTQQFPQITQQFWFSHNSSKFLQNFHSSGHSHSTVSMSHTTVPTDCGQMFQPTIHVQYFEEITQFETVEQNIPSNLIQPSQSVSHNSSKLTHHSSKQSQNSSNAITQQFQTVTYYSLKKSYKILPNNLTHLFQPITTVSKK